MFSPTPRTPWTRALRIAGLCAALASTAGGALAQTPPPAPAAAPPPGSDIFVVSVRGESVGAPQRVTEHPGYDSQPQFLPDGRALVYSSVGPKGADIYRYELGSGERTLVAETPESEYSPTPIPGRNAISVVRDYGNQKQELWSYPLGPGQPELLLPDVNPVGYHAWIDEARVLLFVLGEPNTLRVARLGSGPGSILRDSPGRVLARMPGGREMSYVDKSDAAKWWVTAVDVESGATRRLVATLDGREDYAWAPDGSLWMGDDSRLYRWTPGAEGWQPVADLDAQGVYGITRLAFAPNGRNLALVASEKTADLTAAYRAPAGQILGAALTDSEGWEKISHLATVIGHRLSGSQGLSDAIEWAAQTMASEGLSVRKQPVLVPHWVRGAESASIIAPVRRPLNILTLGGSVGTPPGGITAPVVVVRSFEELEALGREKVQGKIVLYAVEWEGYGRTVRFRSAGPSRAAALGAVASLTRSATGSSLSTPHTGALRYDEAQPRIPAAAVTVEDAEWIRRMAERGREVTVQLQLGAQQLPDAPSFNVIAEIAGSERPEEVVVMGGHFDSWDVGQGVHDDGAACVAAWQALRIVQQLGLRPRRTLRVVLWTNEENGGRGADTYREALGDDEVRRHVAAIEMDGGVERPIGFGLGVEGIDAEAEPRNPVYEAAFARMQQIGHLFDAIDAGQIQRGGENADIEPLMAAGVPGLALRTVGEHYFDWHHTQADTLDKLDPQALRRAIALFGVTGFVLADMPERLLPQASE